MKCVVKGELHSHRFSLTAVFSSLLCTDWAVTINAIKTGSLEFHNFSSGLGSADPLKFFNVNNIL